MTTIDPSALLSNQCANALATPLEYFDVPEDRVLAGAARIGTATLGQLGEHTIGVWELSPSITTDVEIDEFFVVLDGEATVAFGDGSPDMALRTGTVGRLTKGSVTTWNVSKTLRKIYIA